jgi:hypothetical protein
LRIIPSPLPASVVISSPPAKTTVTTPLSDLELVCERCDTLAPPRAPRCPRCGLRFLEDETATIEPSLGTRLARLDAFAHSDAELLLLRGAAAPGTVFPIPRAGATLGRTRGTIRIPGDETLAPLSASFAYRDHLLYVRDEGGPSGVLVRITSQEVLEPGASFALGDHLLRHGGVVFPPTEAGPRQGAPLSGPGPYLRLETILFGGGIGRVWLLPFPIRIGRRLGDVVLSDDRFVSGRHCALYWDGEKVLLEDLGSTNGTFLRIPRGTPRPLRRGDTLRLGRNILRVR